MLYFWMRRMFKIIFGALSSLIIAGCATTPLPSSQAKAAPVERVLAFQEKSEVKNATLVLTRDEGFLGSACYYGFWIDSILSARLGVGETASFFVEPGERLLRVTRDPQGKGLCGDLGSQMVQRESMFRANERKQYRLMLDPNGGMDVQRWE